MSALFLAMLLSASVAWRIEAPVPLGRATATSPTQIFVHARRVDEVALRNELALRLSHAEVSLWTRGNTADVLPKLEHSIWIDVEYVDLEENAKIRVIAGDGRIYERQNSARREDVVTTLARDLSTLLLAIENRSLAPQSTTANVVDEVEKTRAVENSEVALEPATAPADEPAANPADQTLNEAALPPTHSNEADQNTGKWTVWLGPHVRLHPTTNAVGGVYQGWGAVVGLGHDLRRWHLRVAATVAQRSHSGRQVWRERLLLAAGIGRNSERLTWRLNLGPTFELWQANFGNTRQTPQNARLGQPPAWLMGLALGGETAYRFADDPLAPRVSVGIRGEVSASTAFDHGLRQIGLEYRDSTGQSTEIAQFGGLELGLSFFVAIEPR